MKLIPKVANRHKMVDYANLNNGDAFIYNSDICVKADIDDKQYGVVLSNEGTDHYDNMCDCLVIPIDAEVKWTYKKQPAKKK